MLVPARQPRSLERIVLKAQHVHLLYPHGCQSCTASPSQPQGYKSSTRPEMGRMPCPNPAQHIARMQHVLNVTLHGCCWLVLQMPYPADRALTCMSDSLPYSEMPVWGWGPTSRVWHEGVLQLVVDLCTTRRCQRRPLPMCQGQTIAFCHVHAATLAVSKVGHDERMNHQTSVIHLPHIEVTALLLWWPIFACSQGNPPRRYLAASAMVMVSALVTTGTIGTYRPSSSMYLNTRGFAAAETSHVWAHPDTPNSHIKPCMLPSRPALHDDKSKGAQ